MELKTHNTYIFRGKKSSFTTPFKGQVNEITKETIQVTNLDTGITFREMKEDFNNEWEAIELVKDFFQELREVMKNTKMEVVSKVNVQRPYIGKTCGDRCLCDGSCSGRIYTSTKYNDIVG